MLPSFCAPRSQWAEKRTNNTTTLKRHRKTSQPASEFRAREAFRRFSRNSRSSTFPLDSRFLGSAPCGSLWLTQNGCVKIFIFIWCAHRRYIWFKFLKLRWGTEKLANIHGWNRAAVSESLRSKIWNNRNRIGESFLLDDSNPGSRESSKLGCAYSQPTVCWRLCKIKGFWFGDVIPAVMRFPLLGRNGIVKKSVLYVPQLRVFCSRLTSLAGEKVLITGE